MKIILDECTPHLVKRRLPAFHIRTVQEMGWTGIQNGQLLRLVEAQFDVLITTDQNLQHQQNLPRPGLSIVVLPSNNILIVTRLLPKIEKVLREIRPGQVQQISD